jgi:hypothetical protein
MECEQMVDRYRCIGGKGLRVKGSCSAFDAASIGEMLDPRGEGDVRGAFSIAHGCDCRYDADAIK